MTVNSLIKNRNTFDVMDPIKSTSGSRRAYRKYLDAIKLDSSGKWCKVANKDNFSYPEPYDMEEFTSKILLEDEFYLMWGDDCCENLSDRERYNIWFNNNYETGMERHFDPINLPDYNNAYYQPTPKRRLFISLSEKYLQFILENVISKKTKIQLPSPQDDGKHMWVKLGPVVHIDVVLEVSEIYTRSVKFKIIFDKYELEEMFFIIPESSPVSIKQKLTSKLERLVYKTLLDDGRRDEIVEMYEQKRKNIFINLKNIRIDDEKNDTDPSFRDGVIDRKN
jgi:hypothetical protein